MKKKILMRGNEAVGEAAILAGCRAYFGYPITPQNEIPEYMSMRLPEVGGVFVQAESEISAISMVLGASAAGARAMTSSSSPGIALKQEGISYLSGSQLPCVVVNMMRGGPGLGNIAGAQSDYYQATRGGGNGDYNTIVLAPENVQELAEYTIKAFELADKYKVVSIVLGDGYLAQMSEPIILPDPVKSIPEKPWALTGAKGRDPKIIASLRLSPENYLEQHNLALQKVYSEINKNEVIFDSLMTDDADYLIVAYGTCARICRQAVKILRNSGIKAALFRPITLWPFPSKQIAEVAKKVKKILTVEMSMGQMVDDVRLSVGCNKEVDFYGRVGGMIPEIEKIVERVKSYE
ncbi:MAG: 3-methyl-2-oxobutanoate dehydrogenase subunit VorB [Spirochaetaceae bacterium]|nr:3-methyl-2-oxobutanoate dehydrogenase subunit VorB [Spirochaetaceae bacterium]